MISPSALILSKTDLFVLFAVDGIFKILLEHYISNASSFLSVVLLTVQLSAPCNFHHCEYQFRYWCFLSIRFAFSIFTNYTLQGNWKLVTRSVSFPSMVILHLINIFSSNNLPVQLVKSLAFLIFLSHLLCCTIHHPRGHPSYLFLSLTGFNHCTIVITVVVVSVGIFCSFTFSVIVSYQYDFC